MITVAQPAMFFAGLILLIPHRIGMSRVNYIIKRYNLPISRAGLLLYKFHNNIELSLLCGAVLGGIVTTIACATASQPAAQEKWRYAIGGCMIGSLFLMLLSSISLFIIYVSGDDFGHLNAFYLTLILLTLFDGFTNAFAFCVNAENSSLYAAAIPLSGSLVTLLHKLYKSNSDEHNWDDFDYHILRIQLIYNIFILSFAVIFWSVATGMGDNGGLLKVYPWNANYINEHWADISPILMLAFSLGTVYAFYPSIAPYSIIDFQYASIIELWILVISSSPTLLFAILDFIPHKNINGLYKFCFIGPGTCLQTTATKASGTSPGSGDSDKIINDGTSNGPDYGKLEKGSAATSDCKATGKGNWSYIGTDSGTNSWAFLLWHCIWFSAIPYILCIQIFMSLLHYPHCSLSSFFFNKPLRIGFISVLFNTLREAMQAGGFAGAGKQRFNKPVDADDGGNNNNYVYNNIHGGIASWNKPITLFVMMFCVFTGDGYLQHYRRCCRDCWPTTGYTKYQSFFYWLHYGFKGGIKSITSSFTDLYYHNLRPQFISYA